MVKSNTFLYFYTVKFEPAALFTDECKHIILQITLIKFRLKRSSITLYSNNNNTTKHVKMYKLYLVNI